MNNDTIPVRYNISELEGLLDKDDEIEISILPNGEVRAKDKTGVDVPKPLTMREHLGGEY